MTTTLCDFLNIGLIDNPSRNIHQRYSYETLKCSFFLQWTTKEKPENNRNYPLLTFIVAKGFLINQVSIEKPYRFFNLRKLNG